MYLILKQMRQLLPDKHTELSGDFYSTTCCQSLKTCADRAGGLPGVKASQTRKLMVVSWDWACAVTRSRCDEFSHYQMMENVFPLHTQVSVDLIRHCSDWQPCEPSSLKRRVCAYTDNRQNNHMAYSQPQSPIMPCDLQCFQLQPLQIKILFLPQQQLRIFMCSYLFWFLTLIHEVKLQMTDKIVIIGLLTTGIPAACSSFHIGQKSQTHLFLM